jgi:hypothetical protein
MGRPATGGPRRIFEPIVGRRWGSRAVHDGVKVYRGSPGAARSYVEADRSRADDYYLAEGTGLAERLIATPEGVESVGTLDGDGYEAWVAGLDPLTQDPRGRLRHDDSAVRFVEVVVNGPKTWSLAAALDPVVADARASSQRAATSLPSSVPSGTPRQPQHSTPTPTSGQPPRIGHAPRRNRSSKLPWAIGPL